MSIETNWQTTRPTIRERAKFMLSTDHLSDVKFVAAKSDGESERKQAIPAHKFILSIGSPVFEAMFYGELAETKDTVELPDCDYESLLELFRYLYSDEVNLSGSNVMRVLYLAKKYIVPSLADKCTRFLQENLDPSNIFSILPFAQKYEEKSLVDRCWKVIDEQTEAAVKSDEFETIERSLLEALVTRDTLTIEEVALFKAVDRWATKQCDKQGLAADGQVKRQILGEEIIKATRFPVMTEKEFATVVLDTNILHPDEITVFFKFFNSVLSSPLEFPRTPRRHCRADDTIHRCGRFQRIIHRGGWACSGIFKDYLGFSVNKNITLHGLCFLGSEGICNTYTVTLEVKRASNNTTVVSKSGTYSSKLLQYKLGIYHGFEVLFDSSAHLKKDSRYRIEALIFGPASGKGEDGYYTVETSGVTFSFFHSVVSVDHNGTCVEYGQFPEVLFSV